MDAQFSIYDLRLLYEMAVFYIKNPVWAVRDILGIRLPPHQRLIIRLIFMSNARYIILLLGRAMGKTFLDALLSLLMAILNTGLRIAAIGGGGFRQGKFVLTEAERIISCDVDGQSERMFVKKALNRKPSQNPIKKEVDIWSIPLKNACFIATVPVGSDGNKIRGLRSHVNIIDERKELKKQIREKVIRAFAFVKKNVVTNDDDFSNMYIDSGTVEYSQDDYWQDIQMYLNKMSEGDKDYLVLKFIYADAFDRVDPQQSKDKKIFYSKYFDEYWKSWDTVPFNVDLEEIEQPLTEETTDIDSWKAEVLCEPMDISGNFFTYEIIRELFDYKLLTDEEALKLSEQLGVDIRDYLDIQMECDDPVVIGVDIARESDYTSIVVIRVGWLADKEWDYVTQTGKTNFANVIYAYQERYLSSRETAKKIYDLLERFPNCIGVALDKRGGGSHVRDELYYYAIENGLPILYDPDDNGEGGIATLLEKDKSLVGNPILKLIMYSDEDNTIVAHKLRGALQRRKLLFAYDNSMNESNVERIMIYKYVKTILRQLGWIKTRMTANWLKFYTSNPEKQKKDLFSAILYAWGLLEEYMRKTKKTKKKVQNIAIYVY